MSAVSARAVSDTDPSLGQDRSLSILIPCHNEAATVRELLSRVRAALPAAELLVVDDGSSDGSAEIIEEHAKALGLNAIFLPQRGGKGAAVREALKHATRPWVVIQDADLEYDPADLQQMQLAAIANPDCAIYGSRYLRRGKATGGSLAPFVGVKVLGILVKLLYGKYLSDTHTCYKMLPTALMKQLALDSQGFEICAEITSKLLNRQVSILEIPISYHPRSAATGKKIGVRDFFCAAGAYWRLRFQENRCPRATERSTGHSFWYLVTRFMVGALLVIAGAMKLSPWRTLALSYWLVLPPIVVFLVGLFEFLLGVAVLTFVVNRAIWVVTVATFATYLAILAWQFSSGQSICQCLGSRSLPILAMFALDGSLTLALWWWRKHWTTLSRAIGQSAAWELFSGIRLALPILALAGILGFGSLDAAVGYVSGGRVLPTVTSFHVGQISPGEMGTAQFEIMNFSFQVVRVIGAKSTCKCVALSDLPLTIPPGESRPFKVLLEGNSSSRAVLQREAATLVLDDPSRFLTLSVTATVVPSPPPVIVSQ